MERDRSATVREFLKEELMHKSDPVGTLGRIQVERNSILRSSRRTTVLGINLLGIQINFPDASYRSIGRMYGISGQRVQQIIKQTTNELWSLAPANIRRHYTPEQLLEGRIYRLNKAGRTAMGMLEEGHSAREIKDETGIDYRMLASVRTSLRRRGIELGYINSNRDEVIKELRQSEDNRHSREVLGRVSMSILEYIRKIEPGLLATVSEVTHLAGYHASNREVHLFANILRRKNFPVGQVEVKHRKGRNGGQISRYYFILSKDKESAKNVLIKARDPNVEWLRRNPVKVIFGPIPDRFPGTWEINKKKGVRAVRPILSGLGVTLTGGIGVSGADFFGKKCPVPIFKLNRGHYCREEDVPKLEKFIKRRLSERKR